MGYSAPRWKRQYQANKILEGVQISFLFLSFVIAQRAAQGASARMIILCSCTARKKKIDPYWVCSVFGALALIRFCAAYQASAQDSGRLNSRTAKTRRHEPGKTR